VNALTNHPISRAVAVAFVLGGSAASAETPPPRHERASSWRTVVIVAPPELVAGPVPAARPAIRPAAHTAGIETASLHRPPLPAPSAPRLIGPGHALDGIASYYWQDQMTASGERFNRHAMTAAHRSLPFGTRVRVTHARTGRSVVVRINDRGPFKKGRVIDLSESAAKAIGMTGAGLAHVRIDVIAAR
jgi:rare lipoprotein A